MKKLIKSDSPSNEFKDLRDNGLLLVNAAMLSELIKINMCDRFFKAAFIDDPASMIDDILGKRWVSIPMYALEEGTLTMYYCEDSKFVKKSKYYKRGWESDESCN